MADQKIVQDMEIGHNIRRLRKRVGLTQVKVVAQLQVMECEISRTSYVKIEAGTHSIRVSELKALQKIFNAKYKEFFED